VLKWNIFYMINVENTCSPRPTCSSSPEHDKAVMKVNTLQEVKLMVYSFLCILNQDRKKQVNVQKMTPLSPQAFFFSVAFSLHWNLFCYHSLSLHFSLSYQVSLSLPLSPRQASVCFVLLHLSLCVSLTHTFFLSRQLFVGLNRT